MSLCINQSNTTWNVLLTSNSTRWSPMVMGRWTQPTNFDLLPPAKGAFMLLRQPRVFSWTQWPHVPPMCARIHGNGASAPSATASRYELIVLPAADSSLSRSTSISRALQRTIDGNKQPGVVLVHQDEPARRERAAFPRQRRYPAALAARGGRRARRFRAKLKVLRPAHSFLHRGGPSTMAHPVERSRGTAVRDGIERQ